MNVGQDIKIYMKFNPTEPRECNINLVHYLKKYIDMLNRNGNVIDILLIKDTDVSNLRKISQQHGIKRLPVLLVIGRPVKLYEPSEIKNYLKDLCRSRIKYIPKKPDEEIRNFQLNEIMNNNENDDFKNEAFVDVARATAETQRRKDVSNQSRSGTVNDRFRERYQNTRRGMNHNQQTFDNNRSGKRSRFRNNESSNIRMIDNPAEIQKSLGSELVNSEGTDLEAQFWENKTESKFINQ